MTQIDWKVIIVIVAFVLVFVLIALCSVISESDKENGDVDGVVGKS